MMPVKISMWKEQGFMPRPMVEYGNRGGGGRYEFTEEEWERIKKINQSLYRAAVTDEYNAIQSS